jgi:hypothetical protein
MDSKEMQKILNEISLLAWRDVSYDTCDNDFISTIDAINLQCNISDELGHNCDELRARLSSFYPEFERRILQKSNIQEASNLIMALHSFIYGRSLEEEDRGPQKWRDDLLKMTETIIAAYKIEPLLHPFEYISHLQYYAGLSHNHKLINDTTCEIKCILDGLINDTNPDISNEEWMKRILARTSAKGIYYQSESNDLRWSLIMENLLQTVDASTLTDSELLLWLNTVNSIQDWYIEIPALYDEILHNIHDELFKRKTTIETLSVKIDNCMMNEEIYGYK